MGSAALGRYPAYLRVNTSGRSTEKDTNIRKRPSAEGAARLSLVDRGVRCPEKARL